jgi:hypothetical protein
VRFSWAFWREGGCSNSPHDHLATPFCTTAQEPSAVVDAFEAAKQKYAVSSADQHGLVKIREDMRIDMVSRIAEACEEGVFSGQREVCRAEIAPHRIGRC